MQATPFQDDIYLGYSSQQVLQDPSVQCSFIGGQPLFLTPPKPHHLLCQGCHNQLLSFIGQLFCPLELTHAYNRVFYILHCPKCLNVSCMKQQAPQDYPQDASTMPNIKSILPERIEIDSQPLSIKDLKRYMKKAEVQVQQEIIQEEEDDDDEEEGEEIELNLDEKAIMKEMNQTEMKVELTKEQLQIMKIQAEKAEKEQKKDPLFEQYRRVMREIDSPILLYSNTALPYNLQPLNPRHKCQHCQALLGLELQLTEQLLLTSPTLIGMQWGSIMVYSCSNSCDKSVVEHVVTQWELDAIKDKDINMLKKKQKQRKRKQKKEEKKEKGQKEQVKEEIVEAKEEEDEGGDWD